MTVLIWHFYNCQMHLRLPRSMEDFDLKCLPTDFVGTSRPSKVINALYEKREKGEKKAIHEMITKRREICENYERLIEEQTEELKRNLDEVRGFIKNELYDSKIKSNHDNANFMEKHEFKRIYTRIQDYTRQQHNLVETFYLSLVRMEKDKAKEFTDMLKVTYDEIKRISYKLPHEYDELIELEIEKINQTILCNNRNYVELKSRLQGEIQNYTKNAIQQLQHVRECWIKFIRSQTEKAMGDLRNQYTPNFMNSIDKLKKTVNEISGNLSHADSVTKIQDPKEWLYNIQQTVANLDQSAQKIMINYKQAAVIIYNRFFQELKVIEETMADMSCEEEIPQAQAEIYTPTLEEITKIYDVELETIQKVWNELVDELSKTIDNTYRFLVTGATLWQKHFRRTEVLQLVMLKDMENAVKVNNTLSEPYETKLNVLIDILRQEPSKDKLKKTLEDVNKLLFAMEVLYKDQYQSEVAVMKKYKNMQELKVDVLLAEVKRFLTVYPPDLEKDPKIQRKRASQTSEIADPTEGLIPNQMIYCKYQIGAISNWQFGLWECIGNYLTVAKAEILAETDKWIQSHLSRIDRRLEVRQGIHALRMEKIQAYIYNERLEELCVHQRRFDEHKRAVEQRLAILKDEYKLYQDMYNTIVTNYTQESETMEMNLLETESSYAVASIKPILNGKTEKSIEEINKLSTEYLEKTDTFFNHVKASHIVLIENMKLFSEGGNFSVQETKDVLKSIEKLEGQVDKVVTGIKKDVDSNKATLIEAIQTRFAEIQHTLKTILEEHRFIEKLNKTLKSLEKDLLKEVCAFENKFKTLTAQFEQSKHEIMENCGNYGYFKDFADGVKEMIHKLEDIGTYLDEATPVRFYSDKSAAELALAAPHSVLATKSRKSDDERIQEITTHLFNFDTQQNGNTFFMILNNILRKYWDDIIIFAKHFYAIHNRCFYLDSDKIPPALIKLIKEMYKKFFHMQNQCETRTMQDTKEYLYFATTYLTFLDEYTDMCMDEYSRKTLKKFDFFFENDIKQALQKNKADIKNQYVGLQAKLKPLYGHPKNKRLLEKLQIEAEIISSETKELFTNIRTPYFEKLEDEFTKGVNNYFALKELVPKVIEDKQRLKALVQDQSLKLNEKVHLLRMMVDYCPVGEFKITKEVILSHCKSFLTSYDMKSLPELSGNSFDMGDIESSLESEPSSSEDTFSEKSPSSSQSKIPASTAAMLETETDAFLAGFRECYDKFYREVEDNNLEETLEILKIEWRCAVDRVLDLYTVKYDQYRT